MPALQYIKRQSFDKNFFSSLILLSSFIVYKISAVYNHAFFGIFTNFSHQTNLLQYPAKADSLGGYGYSSYGYDTDDAYGGAQTARSGPYGDTRLPKPASGLPGYGGYRNPSTMSPNPLTPKQHRSTDGIQHRGYGIPSSQFKIFKHYGYE